MKRAENSAAWLCLVILLALVVVPFAANAADVKATVLRTEWLVNPLGIDTPAPRLSWQVESTTRGQKQTAYRMLVASTEENLAKDKGDLWDTSKVASDETLNLVYAGKPLVSAQRCFWKLRIWDKDGKETPWSEPALWLMGLLKPGDWKAQWISFRDRTPVFTDRKSLFLPPARNYRKEFKPKKAVKHATVYVSALGIFELHFNGQRVDDTYFEPGWSDYLKRAYYRTHDVTKLMQRGDNAIGAIVTDGWYAGYVGNGLLAGYGPNKAGRYLYGKTPALLMQLDLEYTDGTHEIIGTDNSWAVTGNGPLREADLLMGETYDARMELGSWTRPGFKTNGWDKAIRAEGNGRNKAIFSDTLGDREVDLGFQRPPKLQAYSAPPIRVTQELKPHRITEPKPGVYLFDLGQNFAGVIRLKVKGPAGTKVQIRYGEMIHPDGQLMTENLRRARVTDYFILRGEAGGEVWSPRFTYHGFQYVELSGLPAKPDLDAVVGLVLHNDTPLIGAFECSDEVMTRFWKNTQWSQRANFMEVPTDCPQRDERLGWLGDAQLYIRTAAYNADVAAFFTKWLDDVEESQRDFGAYPDYSPYPMAQGQPRKTFGTAWTDAGIICPWTIWRVYGDTRVIERHWNSMTRFMDWRAASTTSEGLGTGLGNPWGDWQNLKENTPIEYIDTCYHALTCKLMAEMADVIGRKQEATNYQQRYEATKAAFNRAYVNSDGTLKVDTQTAYVLALRVGLLPENIALNPAADLADKIAANGYRMATGFLGTGSLLPVLSAHGQHDLAVRLFQSRQFPAWGYEVKNGANTVWERWDSYTKEDGFGRGNAALNSFSHYSPGAVMEWGFRSLAGIDSDGPGFKSIIIRPGPPNPGTNPENKPIGWVNAEYGSVRGRILSSWWRNGDRFQLETTIPANTTATVYIPAKTAIAVSESGKPLTQAGGVTFLRMENGRAVLAVESGSYKFDVK